MRKRTLTTQEKETLVEAMQVAIAQTQRKIKAEKHAGIRELLNQSAAKQMQVQALLTNNQESIEI